MIDSFILDWLVQNFKVFALVLVRVGAMLFLMPVFSGRSIPVSVKALLCMVISLVFTPVAPVDPVSFPLSPVNFVLHVISELFLGFCLALMMRLVLAGVQAATQMAGFQMGLSMANILDPHSGSQSLVLSELFYLACLCLILVTNSHHLIISAIFESFSVLKPGTLFLGQGLLDLVLYFSKELFVLSVKIMAPVMAILLFSQVALGILAKTVPQMNLLVISFALNIGLGLFFVGLTLQVFWPVFSRSLAEVLSAFPLAIRLMAGY